MGTILLLKFIVVIVVSIVYCLPSKWMERKSWN